MNARRVKLWQVLTKPRMKFLYEYDFGDGWEHEVVLEKILPSAERTSYPICLEGTLLAVQSILGRSGSTPGGLTKKVGPPEPE